MLSFFSLWKSKPGEVRITLLGGDQGRVKQCTFVKMTVNFANAKGIHSVMFIRDTL